jgi:hypothetical protein
MNIVRWYMLLYMEAGQVDKVRWHNMDGWRATLLAAHLYLPMSTTARGDCPGIWTKRAS